MNELPFLFAVPHILNQLLLLTVFFILDVYEWFIGYYSEELGSRLNDGIYVVPSMVFDENGAISKVFCSYASGGGEALNLLVRIVLKSF